ncbi:MAG TPA: glycosyltransferase family 2 protein [Gammaproteobacteria bacterium]|nr:glycosyltransferase family 2 protein [Gammaproteobacteria bacterium]
MNLKIIIPAYNEEKVIGPVLQGLPSRLEGINDIELVVIDDGSVDDTALVARNAGATVIRHGLNCGLGGAIGTGLEYARITNADLAVTFDADGQHDPDNLPAVLGPLIAGEAAVVIGSRMIDSEGMPMLRTIGNWGLSVGTYFLFGTWCTDSQSGFRAFSRKAIQAIKVDANYMEVSSDIIREIGDKDLRLKEIPIKAKYSSYSIGKGQRNWNAINIMVRLVVRKIQR